MKKCRLFKIVSLSLLVVLVLPIKIFADTCSNGNMGNDNLSVNLNNNQYGVNANGGSSNLGNYIYSSEEIGSGCVSSSLYCITPDGGSQGGGMDYSKVDDLSEQIRDCTNSKTGSEYCGMAGILQVAYGSTAASDATQSNNWNQMDAAVTMALRLWAARNPQGTTSFFSDEHYDGAITKAANILFDKIERGESVSPSDVSQYLTDKEGSKTLALAIEWYQQAVKGVDLKRADNFIQNTPSVIVGENGVSYEYKANSSNIQGIGDVTVEGVSSDQIKFEKVSCSDGSGDCYTFSVSDEAIDQLCKGKPAGTTISYSVKVKSNSAINKMYLYKPSKKGGNQYFVGFNAYDEDVSIDEEIECPDSSKKCVEDPETGKCYGPKGEEIDCDKMEEVCGPCIIEDGKCYRNEEEVDCDECDICIKQGDNCFVAGQQVDCEDYPECEDTCEKRGDKCYVGEKEVPCEDYPECTGICERNPGEGCTLGGVPVDCNDYEECKDLVCHKEGDTCYLGEGENKKVVPCGAYPDPECQVDEEENPDNCPVRKIDELPYYTCKDGDTEGELADPPMCTILKNSVRGAYKIDEYSNEWCDVYCRETYSFKFMDKETVQSGRYFRHDVESKYVTVSNLSTVVTATQQCTSLINYDEWKKAYIAANRSVRTSWNELKKWEARWEVSDGQSGLPTEVIDCGGGCSGCCHGDSHPDACGDWAYLWYDNTYGNTNSVGGVSTPSANLTETGDAAVCASRRCTSTDSNGYCTNWVCDGLHKQAKTAQQMGYSKQDVINGHRAAIAAYTGALDYRQSLIQKLFDCNFYDDGEVARYFASSDPSTYTVSYWQQGSHNTTPVKSNTYHQILQNYAPNSELIDLRYDDQTGTNGAGSLRDEGSDYNVWFDKEIQPAIGTEGIEENKGYKTSAESNDPNDSTVCGGCDDPIHDSLSDTPKDDEEYGVIDGREFTFWVCYEHTSGGYCRDESSIISLMPKNYVANLEVTREIGYWQKTRFSTEIFTGKVVEGSAGLQLPEKSWPVAISTLTGDYNIFLKFSKFGDEKRKNGTLKLEFYDDVNCAYTVVNEMTKYDCDDGYHECYDCDDPSTPENECYPNGEDPNKNKLDLGFYFRSIDLDDMFPNSVYSPNQTLLNPNRPIGSNWNTQNAIQVINKIQDLGEGYLGGGKEPEYSVTLTPAMRKQISKNNREIYKANYLTPSTLNCNHSTAICQSTWLQNDLRNILEDYNHGDYYVQNDNSRNNLYVVGRN